MQMLLQASKDYREGRLNAYEYRCICQDAVMGMTETELAGLAAWLDVIIAPQHIKG